MRKSIWLVHGKVIEVQISRTKRILFRRLGWLEFADYGFVRGVTKEGHRVLKKYKKDIV